MEVPFVHAFVGWFLEKIGSGVSSAAVSIIINGSPKGFFPAETGLREGDPLSPFLFLVVNEALGRMIKGAVSAGLFEGVRVARNSSAMNHMQFADDALIFCGENED